MRLRQLTLCVLFVLGGALSACDNSKNAPAKADTPAQATDKAGDKTDDKAGAAEAPKPPAQAPSADGADAKLPLEAKGPVAIINGQEITAAQFNEQAKRLAKMNLPAPMLQTYKKQLLNYLVDEHILDLMVKQRNISVSEADVDEEFQKLVKRFPSQEEFKSYFERSGSSEAELKERMRKQLAFNKLLIEEYKIAISDEDAKKFYEENKERYKQEEQIKASHILLKLDRSADDKTVKEVEKKAKELAKKAKTKGTDFEQLARETSEGPSAPQGGDLGLFPRRRMVKPFSDAAFELKPGEISEPVRTQFGFHIIKVHEKQPERVIPFEEVKGQIVDGLKGKELRDKMMKFLEESKKEMKLELKEDNIVVNAPATPPPSMDFHGHGHGHGHGGHDHEHGESGHDHAHGQAQPKEGDVGKVDPSTIKLKAPELKLDAAQKPGLKLDAPAPK